MGKFNVEWREPVYTSPDKKLVFYPNPHDGPGGFDCVVNDYDHFYIQDRTLGDLTNPEISTDRMMRSLEAMCGEMVKFILKANDVSPEQLHIGLLQLRIQEQEREIEHSYVSQASV